MLPVRTVVAFLPSLAGAPTTRVALGASVAFADAPTLEKLRAAVIAPAIEQFATVLMAKEDAGRFSLVAPFVRYWIVEGIVTEAVVGFRLKADSPDALAAAVGDFATFEMPAAEPVRVVRCSARPDACSMLGWAELMQAAHADAEIAPLISASAAYEIYDGNWQKLFPGAAPSAVQASGCETETIASAAHVPVVHLALPLNLAPPPIPVILDHDGGVDDLIALVILASAQARPVAGVTARGVTLRGVTIVDADCFAGIAADCCRRVLSLFHEHAGGQITPGAPLPLHLVPVAASPLPGTAAPFPSEWRKDCLTMLNIPCLRSTWVDAAMRDRLAYVASNERQQAAVAGGATTAVISPEDEATGGHKALAELVCSSDRPVSIVVTGPLTNVAWALRERGEAFARNVREVIIMGGAVDVKGNVFDMFLPRDRTGVAGSAEWNIYWDAPAAKAVIESPLLRGKVLLFSLDATNHVPVTPEFVSHFGRVVFDPTATAPPRGVILPAAAATDGPGIPIFAAAQPTLLSQFVGASWTTCTWLELLHGSENGYYAWDALTAAYLVDPDVVEFVPTPLTVVAESTDPHEGRTARVAPEVAVAAAHVACRVSAPRFNQMMLELCTYT